MLTRKREPLQNRWKTRDKADAEKIKKALLNCTQKVKKNIAKIGDGSLYDVAYDGVYKLVENKGWTEGFYPGMLWISYAFTGDEEFLKAGKVQSGVFEKRCRENKYMSLHDIGFLFSCSSMADFLLTGDEGAKKVAIDAAYKMSELYMHKAGVINRGGGYSTKEKETEMFIIDCMNNTPLLFKASELTGDRVLYEIAFNHMKNSTNLQVLDCGAICQVGIAEIESGRLYRNFDISQGKCGTDAVWSRGQAWAVAGLPITYGYTKDKMFLEAAKKTADFFLNTMPENLIAPWDLYYTDNETQKDSSASAIAACGLLELSEHLSGEEKEIYYGAAVKIINKLIDEYMIDSGDDNMGILAHGTYQLTCDKGVDTPNVFGDYYFMEALFRLTPEFKRFW